ncbi:MAG: hypothetical protein GX666_00720 [Tissierellia bacterium]|nr:hypothetical protein [Tissierellia bacterium]
MKLKFAKIIESLFSIFVIIAIAGGGIVFLMFVVGIILGGDTGNSLAISAKNVVMPMFIRSAAVSVFLGLLHYYIIGNHALTMEDSSN